MKVRLMSGAVLTLTVLTALSGYAQDGIITVTARANLTTSSQLFTNPNATDPIEQNQFVPIENEFGAGIEVKYTFVETNLALSISADYLKAGYSSRSPSGIPVDDGYRVVPVELTAFFIIPISGPKVTVFMGGGGGAYVGKRIYRLGGVEAPSVGSRTGFGIHVLGGASYHLTTFLSITGEMKFRDLQFDAANAFRTEQIVYNGRIIEVGTEPFYSRVHTDGIVFNLGVSVSF